MGIFVSACLVKGGICFVKCALRPQSSWASAFGSPSPSSSSLMCFINPFAELFCVPLSTEPVRAISWRTQVPSGRVQAWLVLWCRAQNAGAMLADELGPGVTHVIAPKDTSAQQASSKLQSAHVLSPVLVSKLLIKARQQCHQSSCPSCLSWCPLSSSTLKEHCKQQTQVRSTAAEHPQLRLHSAFEAWEHAHHVQRLQTRTPSSYFIRMPACTLHSLTAKTYPEGFDLPPLKLTPDKFCQKRL